MFSYLYTASCVESRLVRHRVVEGQRGALGDVLVEVAVVDVDGLDPVVAGVRRDAVAGGVAGWRT